MQWFTYALSTCWVCDTVKEWFKRVKSIVRLLLYLLDVGTDIFAAYQHFTNDDIWEAKVTIIYIMFPIIITVIAVIYGFIQDMDKSVLNKCLLVTACIFSALILPFIFLVQDTVVTLKGNDPDSRVTRRAGIIKLLEATLEAFPQATLQMRIIIFQIKTGEREVEDWQWAVVVLSLFTLCFTVSTSDYIVYNATKISKTIFFFFGLMAVTSRLLVYCLTIMVILISDLSSVHGLLAIAPYLTPSITIWLIKRFYVCGCLVPLASVHHRRDMWGVFHVVLSWQLTAIYNCFTLSGFLMSTITFTWTVGLWFLYLPLWQGPALKEIANAFIPTTIFAAVIWITNVLLVVVPQFRSIGEQWLNINEDGESSLY